MMIVDESEQLKHQPVAPKPTRITRRYYIDELGFYRFLDEDQKHYVCSNTSVSNKPFKRACPASLSDENEDLEQTTRTRNMKVNGDGIEVCFMNVRRDLGISHFDKTEDYENWKRGWDEFLRVKLTSQQPVTLNRELKNRVRSGIPHDYRCKVWTALIRMRTRNIRARCGDDIYDIILSDFVSKVSVAEYLTEFDNQDEDTNNNEVISTTREGGNHCTTTEASRKSDRHSPIEAAQNHREHYPMKGGSSYIAPMLITSSLPQANNQNPAQTNSGQLKIAQESQIDQWFKQIELDLLRTLPNNRHFENPNSIGIQRVRRVLRAYSCFDQEVGYCQGMNRLAAMALLVLPEVDAFWCLVTIIRCIMPKDYYLKPWLAQVDCCVLSDLLEKKIPKLHKHLAENDIQLTLFSWFFTIFVDGFRPELLLRIWDIFLIEGDKILFRFALAILYLTQDELLKMTDFSLISNHLHYLVSTRRLDIEQLLESK